MAAPHIEQIKALTKDVWPAVRDGMAEQIRRRAGRKPTSYSRRVVEQTLFELHRAGHLLTPEQAEVIDRAKEWHAAWGDDPIETTDEDVTEEDVVLYNAIGQLP